ncbi:MAG: hypothetical protein ABJM29_19190, partial [Rhizobiaceae bacterium]
MSAIDWIQANGCWELIPLKNSSEKLGFSVLISVRSCLGIALRGWAWRRGQFCQFSKVLGG